MYYEDWEESLDLYLAIANLDLVLRTKKHSVISVTSTEAQRTLYEKWEHFNRVCLKVISYTKEKSIRQSISESESSKDYLKYVGENFTRFDMAKKCEYLSVFEKTKYDDVSDVREHIMKLINYYNKLKALKVEIGESTLI